MLAIAIIVEVVISICATAPTLVIPFKQCNVTGSQTLLLVALCLTELITLW